MSEPLNLSKTLAETAERLVIAEQDRAALQKRVAELEAQNSKLRMGLNSIVSNSPGPTPVIPFMRTKNVNEAYGNGNDRAAQTLGGIARIWLKEAGPALTSKVSEQGGEDAR